MCFFLRILLSDKAKLIANKRFVLTLVNVK